MQTEHVPQEVTQLKEADNKRIGWVKLIRLQLNALHEKKIKNAYASKATDSKVPEDESPEIGLVSNYLFIVEYLSHLLLYTTYLYKSVSPSINHYNFPRFTIFSLIFVYFKSG